MFANIYEHQSTSQQSFKMYNIKNVSISSVSMCIIYMYIYIYANIYEHQSASSNIY